MAKMSGCSVDVDLSMLDNGMIDTKTTDDAITRDPEKEHVETDTDASPIP